MNIKKIIKIIGIIFLVLAGIVLALFLFGTVAQAAGLVDDTINVQNLYSQYSIKNYQLDFYVDNSWGWLPWNWGSGIGKSVMYGLYMLTNIIWMLGCYISNATGSVIQEGYKLDFVKEMSNEIGKNIQTLAGITPNGYSADGFYLKTIMIIIVIVGIYAAFTGLVKHETSKALNAILNFVLIFVTSSALIAYAPDYINKVNDLSADLSTAALSTGAKFVLPNSSTQGKDSVDLIRDSLFSIQVKQPWLLLQYGTTDINEIGADRVNLFLSLSPGTETRENVVKSEVETHGNTSMSISDVGIRLGMVFFLFFFNLGISAFVFLLVGIMLLSQILFICFAMFLPVSFLISMIPGQQGKWRQAIMKLFNTIMTRLGITLIITVAFSISSMLYSLSSTKPFFMIAFLQIVCFAGMYMKLGELLGILNLQDHQSLGKRMMQKPLGFAKRHSKKAVRMAAGAGIGIAGGVLNAASGKSQRKTVASSQSETDSGQMHEPASLGSRVGRTAARVANVPSNVVDKVGHVGSQIKNAPTNVAYGVYSAASDLKNGTKDEWKNRKQERADKKKQYRENIDKKREMLRYGTVGSEEPKSSDEENVVPPQKSEKQKENSVRQNQTQESSKKSTAVAPGKQQKRKVLLNGRPVPESQKGNQERPLQKSTNIDTVSRYQSSSRKARPEVKEKEPKKKKLFQQPDYNEDMTAFRNNVKERAPMRNDISVMLHTARRTPEVIERPKEAMKLQKVNRPHLKENMQSRSEKGHRK
jgi:hypothetical protein